MYICPECESKETTSFINLEHTNNYLEMLDVSTTVNPLLRQCMACEHVSDISDFDDTLSTCLPDPFLLEIMPEFGRQSWPVLIIVARLGQAWEQMAVDMAEGNDHYKDSVYVPYLDLHNWLDAHFDYVWNAVDMSREEVMDAIEDVTAIEKQLYEFGILPYEGLQPRRPSIDQILSETADRFVEHYIPEELRGDAVKRLTACFSSVVGSLIRQEGRD